MGGGQIVYVFPFFPGEKRETHKQNSQEISGKGRESPGTVRGESRDNPAKILFMCFLVYCFFFFPGPNQKLASGYFANGYFEKPWKKNPRTPLKKRREGTRLDPSDTNRRPANPLKNVRLSLHWDSKCPSLKYLFENVQEKIHAQYDWTTRVPDNGNAWRKLRAVPRLFPLRSLVLYIVY